MQVKDFQIRFFGLWQKLEVFGAYKSTSAQFKHTHNIEFPTFWLFSYSYFKRRFAHQCVCACVTDLTHKGMFIMYISEHVT